MKKIIVVPVIIAVSPILIGGAGCRRLNQAADSPTPIVSPGGSPAITSLTPLAGSTATATPPITPPPKTIVQPSISWTWEKIGCGSSTPCTYQVCSVTNPKDCYSCQGKYDKLASGGEKVPQKNENPKTTTNFVCTPTTALAPKYSCRVPCIGAKPAEQLERDCRLLLTQIQCAAYTSGEFPYRCEWLSENYQCPAFP